MDVERDIFSLSGPSHLTTVDWKNIHHRRSVAACLVQGAYGLERDRQQNRQGPKALAPPWWQFFHFRLHNKLMDDVDNSIFGAVYELKTPDVSTYKQSTQGGPRYVIAFRGTNKGISHPRDLTLDLECIRNGLHRTSRFVIAMQAVQDVVAAAGGSEYVWLAGHSLGSSIAMLAGKNMAKTGTFLEAFLFNPPFVSAPIEKLEDEKLKHGIRVAGSFITAGLALVVKGLQEDTEDPFVALSAWVPSLFVNPADHICSEYAGYFEHRRNMETMGVGSIGRLATQNSLGDILLTAIGSESVDSEPLHLLPSANLTINLSPSPNFRRAHGLRQWWAPDLHFESKVYIYT